MKKSLSRRQFLKGGALVPLFGVPAAGIQQNDPAGAARVPVRTLGKTGLEVSSLGFGAGSRFCSIVDEDQAQELLELALELGVTYFDTAASYTRDGVERLSEKRLGEFSSRRRGEVFLATKLDPRDREGALRSVEESLRHLQTDWIDLIQIHSLKGTADIRQMRGPDGALAAVRELKEQKVVRLTGITGHNDGTAMRQALEEFDLDTVLMALNPAQSANPVAERSMEPLPGFEREALPVALARQMGVISMKAMGQDLLVGQGTGRASAAELLRFSLNLPVACVVVGIDTADPAARLRENAEVAARFRPMSDREQRRLRETVSSSRPALARFFQDHDDSLPV